MKKCVKIAVICSAVLLGGCQIPEPGDSIVGKWVCEDNAKSGWQIEYRADKTYSLTFNDGAPAWTGKYLRKDFSISYQPDVATRVSSNWLQPEMTAVDRNGTHQILFGTGSNLVRACTLVEPVPAHSPSSPST